MLKSRPRADTADTTVPVAIYTRVSTDNQVGGRFDSLDSQAAVCRDHIQKRTHEGWHEVACFTDAAYSGGTMNRPGIQALKRQIEAGEIKVVLIFKLERVLRSTDEWVPFRAFLQKHNCRLESATEDLSEATASGRLKNNVLMSVAEYERQNTAEKTRAKMEQQAKRGFWNGGLIPFGYTYDPKTQTLHPDPEEAKLVRRIYDHAANLGSLTDLANQLNAEGHRTKLRTVTRRSGAEEQMGGRMYRSDALRLLIQNLIYKGALRFDGKEFQGKHEPLVPKDTWDRANAAVSQTEVRAADLIPERDKHNNLLKGLAWCGHCNRAMIPHQSGKPSPTGKPYRYYYCGYVMREKQPTACPVGRLSADALESAVVTFLSRVGQHPQIVAGALVQTRAGAKGDRHALRAELKRADEQVTAVARELANCADVVAKGGLDALSDALRHRAEELRVQHQQLTVARERKRQELTACETSTFDEQRVTRSIEKLGSILSHLPADEQKELIGLFIQKVEIRGTSGRAREDHRVLALRIKLALPQLVAGVEAKERTSVRMPPLAARAVSFDSRMGFSRAAAGEVTILAPFEHRIATSPKQEPPRAADQTPRHAIVRAQEWQQMLDDGRAANRVAIARMAGVTPGAVTRILKLVELHPEIQAFLGQLKSSAEIRAFPIKQVGELSALPPEKQRVAFACLRERCGMRLV